MIVLFGLAGSGKGTQGKILSEIFGWRWLSNGEAIRRSGKYEEIINRGELIPDEDVNQMMDDLIREAEDEGFDVILDGYPRTKTQAEYVVEHFADKIDGAIILEVPKEELFKRLDLRGRDDDKTRESIEKRFEVFENNIEEILTLFRGVGIQIERIDGVGTVEQVTGRLVEMVEQLDPDAKEQKDDVNGGEIERSYGE